MEKITDELKTNLININNEFKNKLKLPIFITYSIVLIIFNWDILFYLGFENDIALKKIQYVKLNFITQNFERIWKPILYALTYSILFPFLQVLINQIVQVFKRYNNKIIRKEELDNAIHNFNVQQQLTGQQSLQQLQNRIDQLILEKDQLISTNKDLIEQLKNDSNELLDSNSIFNSEYEKTAKKLFTEINELDNEEKSTFLELINFLESYRDTFSIKTFLSRTSYPQHAEKTKEILLKYNLIENALNGSFKISTFGIKFIQFFKSNYIK